MEHGFGGTLLLGSSNNTNTNNTTNTNTANATHNSDPTGGNSNIGSGRDSGELHTSARLTADSGGLTRSSSGTSHDSAVDLFYQDRAFDAPITAKNEYELQLAQALALSVQEAEMETLSYDCEKMEQIDAENAAQRLDQAVAPESTFTFNISCSTSEGDVSNSQVSTSQEPVSQPAVPSQRQHKLYSLQELQQHKQQQASERTLKPHQRVKKVRQEEKEEGEISTSAVSTYGESEEELGPFTFNKTAFLQAPQAAHSPALFSPYSKATSSFYNVPSIPSADINTSTQQSEDQQCYTAHSTQDSAVPVLDGLEEGEVIDGQEVQDEQETEPQFEGSPVPNASANTASLVGTTTAGSTQARKEKKNKPQPGTMKPVSPADLLQMMLAPTPGGTCMTPDPHKSNINNSTRGCSSNEPISLENTPSGSPDK